MDKVESTPGPEWLEARKKGVGGSETAALMGLNPWKNPMDVWMDKRGYTEPIEPNGAMKRGTAMEGMVAEMFSDLTGRLLKRYRHIQTHPQIPYMIGNPDRCQFSKDHEDRGVLEIKCPGLSQFGKMERNGPRQMDIVQLHHYMAITGLKWGTICAHNAERWEMLYWDIDRDEGLIYEVENSVRAFWEVHIKGDQEPDPAPPKSSANIPKVEGKIVMNEAKEWGDAVNKLREIKDLQSELKEMDSDCKATITSLMGEADSMEGHGARIYNKLQAGRKTFQKAQFVKDHPKIDLEKYYKAGKSSKSFKSYWIGGE
jgi:putative phage-type endonuclease